MKKKISTRIIRHSAIPAQPQASLSTTNWPLITALSITTLIVALNVSFPNLSNTSTQALSTYQTRLPTIQYRNPIPKFVYLSYLNPRTGLYFKGNDDIYLTGFWVLVWVCLREIVMKMVWVPVGLWCRLKNNSHHLERFCEQGWNLVHYSVFWAVGMKILSGYPKPIFSLDIRQYWKGYPDDSLPALTKFYYLSQTAFWFQQIIVLHVEKARKDHYQMLAHHIVTVILVCLSYSINLTGTGVAVHTLMDFADIFLSLAKMFNYLGGGWLSDTTFLIFVISWIYTRHYAFGKVLWALYHYFPIDLPFGWRPEEGWLATRASYHTFLVLMCILQVTFIFWLWSILKIMWGFLNGKEPEDERSDTE